MLSFDTLERRQAIQMIVRVGSIIDLSDLSAAAFTLPLKKTEPAMIVARHACATSMMIALAFHQFFSP